MHKWACLYCLPIIHFAVSGHWRHRWHRGPAVWRPRALQWDDERKGSVPQSLHRSLSLTILESSHATEGPFTRAGSHRKTVQKILPTLNLSENFPTYWSSYGRFCATAFQHNRWHVPYSSLNVGMIVVAVRGALGSPFRRADELTLIGLTGNEVKSL